jgi:hypothetical protein
MWNISFCMKVVWCFARSVMHYRYICCHSGWDVCMPYHSIPTKTNDDDPETVSYSCDFSRLLLLDTASWRFPDLKLRVGLRLSGSPPSITGTINFQRLSTTAAKKLDSPFNTRKYGRVFLCWKEWFDASDYPNRFCCWISKVHDADVFAGGCSSFIFSSSALLLSTTAASCQLKGHLQLLAALLLSNQV